VTCPEDLAAYYGSPQVRARIAEYCGGVSEVPESFAAWGMAGYGGRRGLHEPDGAPVAVGCAEWATLLTEGADVCRSLADRGGALLQLDLDYVNPTDRAEPYRDPAGCFARMEPAYEAVQAVFTGYGLRPFVLMTGRGYHFTLRATSEGPFHSSLVEIGLPPASLRQRYRAFTAPARAPAMGRAHDGAGRLLEHLAHEAIRRLAGRSPVPVTLADVAPPGLGPFVCLDLTSYADPLFERYARCAYSGNQKSAVTRAAPERPFTVNLPRDAGEGLAGLLRDRADVTRAAERSRHVPARIPDAADARAWVEEYRGSRLARFHRKFDSGPEVPHEAWPDACDRLDLRALPACARLPLEDPNPALLIPVYLRTVALTLWGLGWHPRLAAAIVRSRYEKDLAWGVLWERYDPAARAAFYVRVICGAFADGLEDAASFTCDSQALRGVCRGGCGWDLGRLLPGAAYPPSSDGRGHEETA
jgi:hypothetical protein